MKTRNTILLLVFGLALGAYLYFFDEHQETTSDRLANPSHIVTFDRDKIDSISIKNPEAKIELRKHDDGQWYLEEGAKDRADASIMAQLFTGLEAMPSVSEIPLTKDKTAQFKEFGIADAHTKIRLTGSEKPIEIVFGKDSGVKDKGYVYVEGGNQIYVANNDIKSQVSKKSDDFRDRKLTALTTQSVNKVEIKSAVGELELTRKNNHWTITKPLEARGDDSKINDLVAQASTARIDQFLSETNPETTGLSEPKGTISFTAEGSDKPVTIQIGTNPKEDKDKDKVYVKVSTREGVVLVPKGLETALTANPNLLRDHNLLRVESDIVDRITIEPAGGEKLVLARKGETWVRKVDKADQAINAAVATRLLSDLQGTQVTDFISDVATELPKYGLDQPQAKVTFSSFASENTAETNGGEKPIVTVLFGKNEADRVFAKLDTEPFIVKVPMAALQAVPKTAFELRDLTLLTLKPEEISAVEVTAANQPTVSLEREKETNWKLTKGEGKVNSTMVNSLVNTLASLRATRWEAPGRPEQGLESPALTLTFTKADKTTGKLLIGSATPDQNWYGTLDGQPGVFLLNQPDHDALTAPLTDKQAAEPAAAPAPGAEPGAPGKPAASTPPPPAPMPAAKADGDGDGAATAVPAPTAPEAAVPPPTIATPAASEPAPPAPAKPAATAAPAAETPAADKP